METERFRPGHYSMQNIGSNGLDAVMVDCSSTGQVWIDTYTKNHKDPEYYKATSVATTFGWINADDAEVIALAILEAVSESRKRRGF